MENTNPGKIEIFLFYSSDCEACKAYMPHFDQAIRELSGTVYSRKIDINKDSSLNNQYNITAVPTTIAVRDGQILERYVGQGSPKRVKRLANL